jgi:hypothetical protein
MFVKFRKMQRGACLSKHPLKKSKQVIVASKIAHFQQDEQDICRR